MGTFYCLGAARMETDECLRILLDRCPDLRPAYRTPDRQPSPPFGRRLGSLPVTFQLPEPRRIAAVAPAGP